MGKNTFLYIAIGTLPWETADACRGKKGFEMTTVPSITKIVDRIVAEGLRPRPNVEAPDVDGLISDIPTEPWLVAAMRERGSSESVLWRCAAVGMFGRLWTPPNGMKMPESLAELIATGHGPAERALAWFQQQNPEARQMAVESALQEVEQLSNELNPLQWRLSADPVDALEAVRQWAHARDDLQCLQFLAQDLPEGDNLTGALKALDEQTPRDLICSVGLPDDDRLWAVALAEQESWWGELAVC